jgi:uncharacterized membrane protein
MRTVVTALLWWSAIGCGLIGGLYFAFSTFIMTALGRIDQRAGISAMNAINVDIVRSLFMPFFLGTTVASAALAGLGLIHWGEAGAVAVVAGGLVYVIGMFVVTMVFNVPLNNALAAVETQGSEAGPVWARYLRDWTFWNHVRTVASLASAALFTYAIAARW